MRFSIQHLLLLGPLFLLNTFLISIFMLSPLRHYRWMHETNRVTWAQERVETSLRYCSYGSLTVTDETINAWLAHSLPLTDPATHVLMDPPRMDSWNNPYRMQARHGPGSEVRVYSTGRDGSSESDGNDPDDIRSWDEKKAEWYQRSMYRRETGSCMILSAIVTPFVFWGLTLLFPVRISNPPPRVGDG